MASPQSLIKEIIQRMLPPGTKLRLKYSDSVGNETLCNYVLDRVLFLNDRDSDATRMVLVVQKILNWMDKWSDFVEVRFLCVNVNLNQTP